jgi:hypothetical protein
MSFNDFGRLEEFVHIVGAELNDEGPVLGAAFLAIGNVEVLFPITLPGFYGGKHLNIRSQRGLNQKCDYGLTFAFIIGV